MAAPDAETILTPNGVDVEFFRPGMEQSRKIASAVYMGDYKYFPNVDAVLYFVEQVMPLIRAVRPDFGLILLGKDAPTEIRALGDDRSSSVQVIGLVEDTRPYLQSASVFVCPLRSGSGTRFKLLEALACGCPVVSTTVGAEGLGATDGMQMLIRDNPREFARSVLEILEVPERGRVVGAEGRRWVLENHAWERSAATLGDAYRRLIDSADTDRAE